MSTATHLPSEPLDRRVIDEINALRGRFHVSQEILGRVIGVKQAQMSARLRGTVPLTLREVEELATFFHTTPGYLMGYENAPRPEGPDRGRLCAIRDSNPEPAGSVFRLVAGWIGPRDYHRAA